MKVKTQLAQLRASRGNVSYEKIAASTGIDSQQLRELEIGEANAIALTTLGKLCAFFQCTPNDLFALDWSEGEIDTSPPTAEELARASEKREKNREMIKKAFARAEAMPPRPLEEIWRSFEATIDRIAPQLENSGSSVNGTNVDA
ncbi:MAG: XRE family transcriptional regulator [Hormoscilla sp. GM102CHS1]|nr:XRE family transcriptional regulator [Hormoscilla sp. GM102CHS1]